MLRRFLSLASAAGIFSLAAAADAQTSLVPQPIGVTPVTIAPTTTGYAPVNGLKMYYEVYGKPAAGTVPLVLIHGAFSAIGTSFGPLIPGLAANRQVVAVELQAHGHTADIDRPLSLEAFADDTVALLDTLGIKQADFYGYSNGAAVALQATIRHPATVRKLVFMSATYRLDGIQPGLMAGLGDMKWEMMIGSPWYDEYQKIAPRPQDFPLLFAKKTAMDKQMKDIPDETIAAIKSPTLIILGDSDLATVEHAAKMYRLLGGGGFGDTPAGLPNSQLAVIPGASHVSIAGKANILVPIVTEFLDRPVAKN
jgi:pimeloyl-ACP methyl ester carboxylesterase